MKKVLHVLLTGGVGSRLWPLSRRSNPKQYLEIFSNNSLFELAIKRNIAISEGLTIVGNQGNFGLSEKVLTKLRITGYTHILEATPRNTAAAIAFAAFAAKPEQILLVTPSDHIIEEGAAYDQAVKMATELAQQDFLVTFGVHPDRAETGYGYLEYENDNVLSFREKPDKQTAQDFLDKGNFLWNSGMFCFKASVFLEELQRHAPLLYQKSADVWRAATNNFLDYELSMEIPSISVDYAVMEKSKRIKVVKADFKWSDMGSFEAVYEYLSDNGHTLDLNKNMHIGDVKPTFFVGLNNCILISTRDANLVVSKEASQDVKGIYQHLEENHPDLIN